jgi:hypothetical protein
VPWSHTLPLDQKTQFIANYLRDSLSITELCQLYHISRKTGYEWVDRYLKYGYSRLLLACQAIHSTAVHEAKLVFTRLFDEFGLPSHIRTDNGAPFATSTLARLLQLSAWWVRLGILPECLHPGKPQQNGRHARRHQTLTAETTRPPAGQPPRATATLHSLS